MTNIIVVDDDFDCRQVLCSMLQRFSEVAVMAEGQTGEEALALIQQHQPDAIFLDVDMPDMNGLEAAAHIRKLSDPPYVIFVTARSEFALRAFELQAIDYLVKPIDPERLDSCMQRILAHTTRHRESVELKQQVQRLETVASMDAVTGIYNRTYLDARLDEKESTGRAGDLAVIILDVDNFKAVNDLHGHAIGDLVLRQLGELVVPFIRDGDTFARYGGEEFVILTSTDAKAACEIAEGVRRRVESAGFGETGKMSITISLGVACLATDETPRDMLERADQALFRAKNSGRNKWVLHPSA